MSQKKSAYNLSSRIWREQKHQFPLSILSFVVLLAAMPAHAFLTIQAAEMATYDSEPATHLERMNAVLPRLYADPRLVLALGLLAILSATTLFHYLHVGQQTDFYHALPLSRWKLFWTQSLTGLLIVVPAYVINVLLMCLVYTVQGYGDCLVVVLLLQKAIVELGLFAVVYAISVLACILCGSTLASLVVNLGLQLGAYAFWGSIMILFRTFYPARLLLAEEWDMIWLSPLLHHWSVILWMLPDLYSVHPQGVLESISSGIIYQNENLLAISLAYLLAAAVLLVFAGVLYRQRRSERTGVAIVFRGLRLPIKYLGMTICGIPLGWTLLTLTGLWPMMFVGVAAGVIFAQCIIEIIFAMDFRAMFSHQLSLWLYVGAAAIALGAMHLDVTGYNVTLPHRGDIVAADVYSTDTALTTRELNRNGSDPKEMLHAVKASLLTDSSNIDEIYSMAQRGVQSMRDEREILVGNQEYDIVFQLKDGSYFVRSYYLAGDEKSEEYNVLTKRAAAVRFSPDYLENRTAAAMADPSDVKTLMVENSSQVGYAGDLIEDAEAITQILDTVREESKQLTQEYVLKHPSIVVVHTSGTGITYELTGTDSNEYNIPIYACEKQTIRLLKKQGVVMERFHLPDVKAITLTYHPEKTEDKTLKNAISVGVEEEERSAIISEASQFEGILSGAIADDILDCCDPIVRLDGIDASYDGMIERNEGEIFYCYLKDKVPNGLQRYLQTGE